MNVLGDVNDINFQAEVLEASVPVLVEFWAPWCGPCRAIAPTVVAVAEANDKIKVVKLNTDENAVVSAAHQILSIPTLLLFRDGEQIERIVGVRSRKQIEEAIAAALA